MSKPFRLYRVIETEGMTSSQLQEVLNEVTDGILEEQIDHVVGTKIILGRDSLFTEEGRMKSKTDKFVSENFSEGLIK